MSVFRVGKRGFSFFALLLTLLTLTLASAEERITSSKLRALGVHPESLQPIAFSHDDRLLAAFDRADFEENRKGIFFRLWLFEIDRAGKFGRVISAPLGLGSFLQGEFTPDDKNFVVIGNRGSTFLAVDCQTGQSRTLFEPEWGKAGFKADPAVLWTEQGSMWALGRFYDAGRFVENQTIAKVRLSSQGGIEFSRGPDLTSLEKKLQRLWFSNYASDQLAFFAEKFSDSTLLWFWDGAALTEIARAHSFAGFWGNGGRLLYSSRATAQAKAKLEIFDAKSNTTKLLQENEADFRYLFLSRDGKTALYSLLAPEKRLLVYTASELDNWQVKPLVIGRDGAPGSLPAGWMRLASRAPLLAHLSETGLALYSF